MKCVKGLRVFWDAEKRETSQSECRYFAQESVNGEIRSCVERGDVRCIQAVMQGLIDAKNPRRVFVLTTRRARLVFGDQATKDESLESLLTTRRAKLVFGDQGTTNP